MLPINKKLKLISTGLAFGVAAGLLVNIFFAKFPEIRQLARTLDLYFYGKFFTPTLEPHPNLVIIDSNDPTESRSRSEYAAMIRQLHQAGAKCVAFDIRFLGEREQELQGDKELVDAVTECPEVVLAADFASDRQPSTLLLRLAKRLALPDSFCQNLSPVIVAPHGVDLPFDSLLSVTNHIGHINPANNENHHFPPVIKFGTKCFASLPVEIVRICTQSEGSLFPLEDVPLDKDGQLLVNFIPVDKFRPYPYSWVDAKASLRKLPEAFQGAIVLIVNSSPETELPTLIGQYPRWAILAALTTQLLLNRHITASAVFDPVAYSAILAFFGLIWFLFVAPRLKKKWRKTYVLFVAGNGLFLLAIYLVLWLGQQWLGVVVPLLVFNTSLLVVKSGYHRMIKPPQYLDFGLAVLERQGQIYPIQIFESPSGENEVNASFHSFLEEETLQNTIQRLKALQARREDIKWMGDKFFNTLFRDDIFYALKNSLEITKNEGQNLRLKLRIDAPELFGLPWELMHSSKLPPGFMALHKRLSLTRYLPLAQPKRKQPFHAPLTILIVISSPSDLSPLDVEGEKKLIKKSLRSLIWARDIRLRFCENATLEKLSYELEREPVDVMHYIGHSHIDPDKKEVFFDLESETSESNHVEAEALGNLLHESSIKLVVLNSCESATLSDNDAFAGAAQILVRVGIPAVVAMQYPIYDTTAMLFSKAFYSTLVTNYSIDAAVAEARRYIMSKVGLGQQDWATPVLFMRPHDGKIFEPEV